MKFSRKNTFFQTDFPPLSAAQIGAILGKTSQAVRKQLRQHPADGQRVASGNIAPTWTATALPPALVDAVELAARQRGYTTPGEMLRGYFKAWKSPVPLSEITPECLSQAAKLKKALLPSLRKISFTFSEADSIREGMADFEKEFGHRISERHFRNLLRRTIERDGGAENWERLELYLPKRPARKPKPSASAPNFPSLVQAINEMEPPGDDVLLPVGDDAGRPLNTLWKKVFKILDEMIAAKIPQRRAATQLRNFLFGRLPQLASSREALKKMFDRRLARYRAGELFDKRNANGADDGELTKQIKALQWFIPAAKIFYLLSNRNRNSGSVPEAVYRSISLPNLPYGWPPGKIKQFLKNLRLRELPTCPPDLRKTILQRRQLYQELVPKSVAQQIRVNPSIVQYFRSPKNWKLENLSAPGSQRRRFNEGTQQREIMQPGDWFGGDDSTPGIAVCVPCNDIITPCSEKFGVLLGRFQWLAYIDARTDKILAWDYIIRPRGSYRAEDILNGMGAVVRTHGVPRQGWQFEGGTWNSKLVREAIRLMGCEHWRTYSPHQKAIESIFNRVWTRLAMQFPHADMGRFQGENEANCKIYEACKKGHQDPRRFFPTLELVLRVFGEIVGEHNAKPINSRIYGQWTPDISFDDYMATNPLQKFTAGQEWILSPYAVKRTVRGMGVKTTVPIFEGLSVPFEFSAPFLPMYSGKQVRIHFNPRLPKCRAKIVLLENANGQKPGDILGDADQIGETASYARLLLSFARDDQRAGFVAKQKTAGFMRRETRGIGAGGRVEYSRSEERDGIGQVLSAERHSHPQSVPDDGKCESRDRLAKNLGGELTQGADTRTADGRRLELESKRANLEEWARDKKHLFL